MTLLTEGRVLAPGRWVPYPACDKTALKDVVVPWIVLALSGVLEAVWATALGKSDGFARLAPSVVFFVALAASMTGLGYAMQQLPAATAYAVWVGIGAVLTLVYATVTGVESVSLLKAMFMVSIVLGVVGLKLVH